MKKGNDSVAISFEEWIARKQYAKGNPEALGTLWKHHLSWLKFQALKYSRQNRDMADDALGDLGAKLARPEIMRMYRPDESWRHWAGCILQNLVRDLMRRKFRPHFQLTKTKLKQLVKDGVSQTVADKLSPLSGRGYWDDIAFQQAVADLLSLNEFREAWPTVRERARLGQSFLQPLHEHHEPDYQKT